MLRCPPSRITLTSTDIADFEQRVAACHNKGKTAKVRLSPGPGHPTRLAFVPAESNLGRIRAVSSSSEATIHNNIPTPEKDEKFAPIHERPTATTTNDSSSSGDEADRAFATLLQRPTISAATPRRQVDSFYGTEQVLDLHPAKDGHTHILTPVDGTAEREPHALSGSQPYWTPRGREILGEIDSGAYPTDHHSRTAPPLLASARARRRHAGSQNLYTSREHEESREVTMLAYRMPVQPHIDTSFVTALEVPEVVLPNDDFIISSNVPLDPGAAVFLPRTRFGTVTGSSQDAPANQIDVSNHYADLRARSSSEQNADQNSRSHNRRPAFDGDNTVSASVSAFWTSNRTRRRNVTANQNGEVPYTTPTLDRYPLMQPFGRGMQRLNGGAPYRTISVPGDQNWAANRQRNSAAGHLDGLHVQARHTSHEYDDPRQRDRIRPVSPAPSTGSRSTPNLLQNRNTTPHFRVRDSSLPWHRAESQPSSFARVASMTGAGSSTSSGQRLGRQSSREALDAATEFLRMRNSPLDDLTEQLSRMSASRPRSVGRSWERPPTRPRLSLLTGDPFRPSSSPNAPSSALAASIADPRGGCEVLENADDVEIIAEDVVALSLALPPSSPLRSSSGALPSTPSLHFSQQQSTQSPVTVDPAGKSPESSIKRKPVPQVTATPKITVYDDKKPPNTQPQTPAAIRGWKRRAKTRSDTSISQHPIFVGQATMHSPPPIPERHPHRNTYPSSGPGLSDVAAAAAVPSRASYTVAFNAPGNSGRNPNQGRFRAQSSSQQAENDSLEGHLQGLEEDRRVWAGRREGGTLDVTPPREGRFERYLS